MFTVPPFINTENKIYWLSDTDINPFTEFQTCPQDQNNSSFEAEMESLDPSIFDGFLDKDEEEMEQESIIMEQIKQSRVNSFMGDNTSKPIPTDLEDNQSIHGFVRHGILNRIAYCEKASFRYIYYSNDQCVIDFSKPIENQNLSKIENNEPRLYLWNGKFRVTRFVANIGLFVSVMSSQDLEIFFIMNEFLMGLLANSEKKTIKKENLEAKHKRMLQELKELGAEGLRKHIEMKIREIGSIQRHNEMRTSNRFSFEYFLEKYELSMTEGEKKFLKLEISKCHGKHVFASEGHNEFKFSIKEIEIDNPMIEIGEKNKILKRLSKEKNKAQNAIMVSQSFFNIKGLNELNNWRVVNNLEIMITPLRVNITKEIYEKISNYLFARERHRVKNQFDEDVASLKLYMRNPELYFKLKDLTLKKHKDAYLKEKKGKKEKGEKKENVVQAPPAYYKRVRLGEMRIVVTFKSNSIFIVKNIFNFFFRIVIG